MSNKRNKRKSDVKSSILVLLLIAILLIASTYAWFTANQTVTISTLDVHVEASNGLQISTDATTWKTIITNEDITTNAYSTNVNQLPELLEPVSTAGEIDGNTGYMNMYYGTAAADEDTGIYQLTAEKSTEVKGTEGKFIAFDVFLKVDTESPLYLTGNSNVVMKAPEGTTDPVDTGLKNASRVAFCIEGTAENGATVDEIIGLKGATSASSATPTTYIWEPNYDVHTAAAVAHARDTYGITTTTGPSAAAAVDCYGILKEIETPIPLANTNGTFVDDGADYFSKVTPAYKTENGKTASTPVFTLNPGITKVRIYMWIEGQDVDCENAASGSDISFNVQFSLNDGTGTAAP